MALLNYSEILSHFDIPVSDISVNQIHYGHINGTYKIDADNKKYILQKINTSVFKNPDELMSNIIGVTDFITKKIEKSGEDASRRTLHFHKCDNGKYYFVDNSDDCWRLYDYVDGVTSYMSTDDKEIFYNCAKAFGEFQKSLSDYPAETLFETIPNFHNTESRMADFKKSVERDTAHRKALVKPEIEFALSHENYCSYITSRIKDGRYSLRVTHNDTKLNNILIDDETKLGICVIDLDTVMPGSVLYDFGDSIRFGACSTAEDETNYESVRIRLDLFEEYTKGFLEGVGNSLSKDEILGLPYGAIVITLETGLRFLADYLDGDTYFAISRENQNLDRARVQFALVADMEKHLSEMTEIVKKYGGLS